MGGRNMVLRRVFQASLFRMDRSFLPKVSKNPKSRTTFNSFYFPYPRVMEKSMNLVTFVSFSPSQIAPQPTPPQNFHLVFFSSGKRPWHEDLFKVRTENGSQVFSGWLFHHMSHMSLGVSSILTLDIPWMNVPTGTTSTANCPIEH